MISAELEVTASKDLLQSLDTLLERYLHLLDRQQQMQSELAKEMSSGFLSLAHANYLCPPGRRYGADYYDERMKANQRMHVGPPFIILPSYLQPERPKVLIGRGKKKEQPKKFQSDDPIYWFGVLVPSSLRTAQKAFTEGIQRQVPELAAVTVEMRGLEQQILHLRTKLDLVS
ncbi:hypothetical protein N7528_007188 [Penicillium herquei]|nr:hypothetical protein N7528_007188 [Penicillium herquei]